jgi:hypothetical protein
MKWENAHDPDFVTSCTSNPFPGNFVVSCMAVKSRPHTGDPAAEVVIEVAIEAAGIRTDTTKDVAPDPGIEKDLVTEVHDDDDDDDDDDDEDERGSACIRIFPCERESKERRGRCFSTY